MADCDEESRFNFSSNQISWRYRVGIWMFWLPVVLFLVATVLVPALGLSALQTAGVASAVMVLAHVIWFASIPLLGKEGFKSMKSRAVELLKSNRVTQKVFDGISACLSVLSRWFSKP